MTVNRARDALRGDVARQVLAPKPRSLGKSAAEGPNDRLQADLIDFSQNTRSAKDVFTREAVTRALPNKNAETVAPQNRGQLAVVQCEQLLASPHRLPRDAAMRRRPPVPLVVALWLGPVEDGSPSRRP